MRKLDLVIKLIGNACDNSRLLFLLLLPNAHMNFLQILTLAIVQGAAELLPVSSSAHVIMAEKWMGLDPTSPQMTMLLVMLHTGTMLAVIVYFWKAWRTAYFSSVQSFRSNALYVIIATIATAIVGLVLLQLIKHVVGKGSPHFEIERLFGNTNIIAAGLAAAGIFIIAASRRNQGSDQQLSTTRAAWVGAIQGLCLPFRGFSRSGATISTGLALGVNRQRIEEFSFALAVVLTPAVVVKEAYRLYQSQIGAAAGQMQELMHLVWPSLVGMALSFLAGLLALRWLSRWLEGGCWHYFGIYCLIAAAAIFGFAR